MITAGTVPVAVVLAGHGSRSAEANAALVDLAKALAADVGVPVTAAYLEMADPSIPDVLRATARDGAGRIVLVPYFLSPGMHVRRDLEAIAQASREELGVKIDVAEFLGAHPGVLGLLAGLTRATLADGRVPGASREP